jgi:flavin reductase (DIM6/NTAB) family NADH-FMN oxidoreductase RutF
LDNKQFVVNLVTEEVVEQMNTTSQSVASDIDEFELAALLQLILFISTKTSQRKS